MLSCQPWYFETVAEIAASVTGEVRGWCEVLLYVRHIRRFKKVF